MSVSGDPTPSTASARDGVLSEEEALDLLMFLVSSAEICLVEPTHYGTFRLIDAASRLMGHVLGHDPQRSGEFIQRFKAEVDTKKAWMMWDREAYEEFLRAAQAQVDVEVKRLVATADASPAEGPA